jgi:hypothetical protein
MAKIKVERTLATVLMIAIQTQQKNSKLKL